MISSRAFAGLMGLLVAACGSGLGEMSKARGGSGDGLGADGGQAPLREVTFHQDIRPLIEQRCTGCHSAGNIGPFTLGYDRDEWQSGSPSWAAAAVRAVASRAMPPWIADSSCHEMAGSRALTEAEIATFLAWRDGGFVQGSEADYVAPELDEPLGKPSLELLPPEAYTPRVDRPDDYRCFILPHTFDETTYLTATSVVPGQREEVHHVILFTLNERDIAEAEQLDAAEEGPGYTCYGGSGVASSETVGGWVPGTSPQIAPADTARVLAPGSRLIMQVHYNTAHAHHMGGPKPDQTLAQLWLMPKGQAPVYQVRSLPVANLGIYIEAGDANSVQELTTAIPLPGTLVGVLPHMHTRGKSIELSVVQDATDACLVRIPDWDFHWQQGYRFTESSYVELAPGDRLKLRCVYDNSDSERDVTWGEGTDDEMCVVFVDIRTKLNAGNDGALAEACPSYHGCVDACPQGDGTCLASCTLASESCASCTTPALASCAVSGCVSEGIAVQLCINGCDGDQGCAFSECADEVSTFFECLEPNLRDGTCDEALASCGA